MSRRQSGSSAEQRLTTAQTDADNAWMRVVLREAVRGLGITSPNPLVGAVAVKRGRLLGKAHHERFGGDHAEIALIRKLRPEQTRDAALYVNLEPCCHIGKTPPCTDAIIKAGFKRVIIGHEDPNPLVRGRGIAQLNKAGLDVRVGVREAESRELNAPFLTYMTLGRPWILLKVAQSLDGRIALNNGQSRWITGEKSRTEVHRMRSQLDAVMVGSQTVLEDDPELTVRHIKGRDPLRIIVDSMLRIRPDAKVLRNTDNRRTLILMTPNAPDEKRRVLSGTGATLLECPAGADGKIDLHRAMKILADHGVISLFVEGGGTLHASFIHAGLFDRFIVAVAPILIGGDGKPAIWDLGFSNLAQTPHLRLRRTQRLGDDLWLELESNVHGNR